MVCWRVLPKGPLEKRADTLEPPEPKLPPSLPASPDPPPPSPPLGSPSLGSPGSSPPTPQAHSAAPPAAPAWEADGAASVEGLCNDAVQLHAAAGEEGADGQQMQQAIALYRRALQVGHPFVAFHSFSLPVF